MAPSSTQERTLPLHSFPQLTVAGVNATSPHSPVPDPHGAEPTSSTGPLKALPEPPHPDIPNSPSSSQAAMRPDNGQRSLMDPHKIGSNDIAKYLEVVNQRVANTIQDWVPHPFSLAEREFFLSRTRSMIAKIETLLTERESYLPKVSAALEMDLFYTRVDYRTTFPRLFRFHDLPSEIKSEIFRNVVGVGTEFVNPGGAMTLTWVCREWRSVALKDPHLWSVIWWKDGPSYTRSRVYLERSGDAPKDIRINDEPSNVMTPATVEQIMGWLLPKIHTVRVMIVILEEWEPLLHILDRLATMARIDEPVYLARLEMHRRGSPFVQIGSGYTGPYMDPIPLFGGKHLPTLRTLTLSGIHVDWGHTRVSNLTSLDVRKIPLNRAPSFDQFRSILRDSPNLQKLILDGAGPNFRNNNLLAGDLDFPPIPLLNLKTLAFADFSPDYAVWLFAHISAPNVRDLTILNLQNGNYSRFFLSMVGKMREVRILTLFNAALMEEETRGPDGARITDPASRLALIRWLESIPKVKFMRLGSLHENFLETFLANPAVIPPNERLYPQNAAILPNLKYLEWQRMSANLVINWAGVRKFRLNLPLEKIYINQELAQEFGSDKRYGVGIAHTLPPNGGVYILRHGHKAPEESEIANEE